MRKAEDMQYVKDEIVKALESAKQNKPDQKLLEQTISRLKYSFVMDNDTPTAIAENLSYATWLSGDPETFNRMYALYAKVTADDIVRVAKKYFVNTALTVATISPSKESSVK
jgi:zinc protease